MDPLRGENRRRVPYLIGAIPFGVMVLLLTWVLLPLADFQMDATGKAQWTGFALLAIGVAAIADHRARTVGPENESRPVRFRGVELRTLTPEERATIPKPALGIAFALLFAILLTLSDSWIRFPVALIVGGLLSLAMARYAQQRNETRWANDKAPIAPPPTSPEPLSTAGIVIVTVGVVVLIISIVAVATNW